MPSWPRPAQLPPGVADFVGRRAELRQVVRAANPRASAAPAAVVVTGVPGVGKTALLVRAAHQLRPAFPGGQLFAHLGGTGGHPADAGEVLAGFLRALGVPATSVPADRQERAALYRSMLADQRILVVLDDVSDEAQVRPLLPTGSRCAALIGSRRRLAGLESATGLQLNMLSLPDAVELLGRISGPDRVALDPAAANEVCRLCGLLPLAIRVAGARLATQAAVPIAAFAGRLADERHRLDLLRAGDLEVRAGFVISHDGHHGAEVGRRVVHHEYSHHGHVAYLLRSMVGATVPGLQGGHPHGDE